MDEKLRLFDLAFRQVECFPNLNIFAHKKHGEWETISTEQFLNDINVLSKGLIQLGVNPGEKVGLIADSSVEWHIVDFAIQQIGAVTVAIYPNITDLDYQFIFNDAEIKLCIVSTLALYNRILSLKNSIYTLKYVFAINSHEQVRNWQEIKNIGSQLDSEILDVRRNAVKQEDLATLIYTSGTTGKPKGVMLTHRNIIANVKAAREITPCKAYDRSLTFLPPCHAYERMVIYTYLYIGITTYIAESLEKIGQNIKEVQPHIMTAVPRILEKVYEKTMKTGLELTGAKRKIFDWAVRIAEDYDPDNTKRSFTYNIKLTIARKLVLNKWYQALGGHLITVASGSASLQAKLAKVFLAAEIPLYEGYGMTEASPLISVNHYKKGIRIGTVGLAVKHMEIRLAEDGEILVKGPNVMQGYYNNPDETAKTIVDGWLHTGDIGAWEEGKFLKIIDRKKEMFKISGGKYVIPQPIEKKLLESNFIEQAMVIGANQKFASAFIVPSYTHLLDWSKSEAPELQSMNRQDFLNQQKVVRKINKEIQNANKHFGNWEQIKRPIILMNEFTIESGELTPTLKMKRKVILEKYKKEFENLYSTDV